VVAEVRAVLALGELPALVEGAGDAGELGGFGPRRR
jgi:hypothetical protein